MNRLPWNKGRRGVRIHFQDHLTSVTVKDTGLEEEEEEEKLC